MPQRVNVLAREGEYWTVVFGGRVSRVTPSGRSCARKTGARRYLAPHYLPRPIPAAFSTAGATPIERQAS